MELLQYWSIIRRWYWLLALGLVLAAASSYTVSKSMTRIYAATVTLRVNETQNPGTVGYSDVLLSQQLAKTYSQLINSRPVVEDTIRQLGLNETHEALGRRVTASPIRDTLLMQATVRDKDPQQASEIANKLAKVFIAQLGESQTRQMSTNRQNVRQQLAQVQNEIDETASQISRLRSSNGNSPSDSQNAELTRLTSMLSQYQLVYSQLVKSEHDLAIAEARLDGVNVVIPAVSPTEPVEPNVRLNTLLAAIVGLAVAVGVALMAEYIDDTVKTSEDVQQAIDVPTFGVIGELPAAPGANSAQSRGVNGSSGETKPHAGDSTNGKASADMLVAADPTSQFGEAYRVLRTSLQFATINRPCRALLISSCAPKEGKSFTTSNLGVVLAQAGKSVILVDADIRRPTQHRVFGLGREEGLVNLLISDDPGNVRRYLQPTEYEGLRVLTSGRPLPPNPTELLGSQQMARVVAALKDEADLVLFDSPPALSVADAAILSAVVDGTLLVVQAGLHRSQVVARAKSILGGPGGAVLGVVINRFKATHDTYYQYYYAYGYRYTRQKDEAGKQTGLPASTEATPLARDK